MMTLSLFSLTAYAQDPYLNNSIVNTSGLYGTSRFVGMGGAMGALGADISSMSSNPAGIGLFTKNNASLPAGVSWLGKNTLDKSNGTFGELDQVGVVTSFKLPGRIRNINFGFNYQKKASYDHGFAGEVYTDASWADQLDVLADEAKKFYGSDPFYYNTIYGLADDCGLFPWRKEDGSKTEVAKTMDDISNTIRFTRGSLNAYEFNLSMNMDDRYYFGLTVGVDNLDYRCVTDYVEERYGENGLNHTFGYINEQRINGNGFNLKFGTVIRPFDSSTFRVGFTVETPTWYYLTYIDDQSLETKYMYDEASKKFIYNGNGSYTHFVNDGAVSGPFINDKDYRIITPWKVRLQMGSTVGNNFAWGMEYQFANYPGTTAKFLSNYDDYYADAGFAQETKNILKPQHTLRAGLEFKPHKSIALRAGYNFITSTTQPAAAWDPIQSDISLLNVTGLDYMNLSDEHILTVGAGYSHKWFYADIAYMYHYRRGEYYAFNQYDSQDVLGVDHSIRIMDPINVNMDRHSIMATIGARF